MTQPDFDEMLRRLSTAEVEFVLVGGMAVGAWGVVRGTKDVDIVVDPDPENLSRLAEMAVAAHGHVEAGESFLGSKFSIAGQLATGQQVAIETELGRLDVVQGTPRTTDATGKEVQPRSAASASSRVLWIGIESSRPVISRTRRTWSL